MSRRFTLTQAQYIALHIAKRPHLRFADKLSSAVAYVYALSNGKLCASVFVGKQAKPVINYSYRNEAEREAAVKRAFDACRASEGYKAERRAARKAFVHSYKAGDLFRRSWGYDQTNVNFYQVVAVKGKTLTVREIAQDYVETGFMCGKTGPQIGEFKGPEVKCLAQDGYIKVEKYSGANAYYVAPKMVGTIPTYDASYTSSYA